jgi:hypothetical protein
MTTELSNSLIFQTSPRKKKLLMITNSQSKTRNQSLTQKSSKDVVLLKVERGKLCSEREKQIMKPLAQSIYTPREMMKISKLQNLSTRSNFIKHCYYKDFPSFNDWNLFSALKLKVRSPESKKRLVVTRSESPNNANSKQVKDRLQVSQMKINRTKESAGAESFSEVEKVTVFPENSRRVIIDMREVNERSRDRIKQQKGVHDQRTLSRLTSNQKELVLLEQTESTADETYQNKQQESSRDLPNLSSIGKTPKPVSRLQSSKKENSNYNTTRDLSKKKIMIMDPQIVESNSEDDELHDLGICQKNHGYLYDRYLPESNPLMNNKKL